jgi:hypothetical protein
MDAEGFIGRPKKANFFRLSITENEEGGHFCLFRLSTVKSKKDTAQSVT